MTRMSVVFVRRLEAGELEPLAHPFGELVEVERLVEHDASFAIRVPAHFAFDRTEAFDDHHDLLADAIFLDRLNLHPPQRDVVYVDSVIDFAESDGRLAGDLEARGARPESEARLAARKKLAEVDILVEL